MYAGTTFTDRFDTLVGAHQKIDKLARRDFKRLDAKLRFPPIKQILHFEGRNGPDGIKSKSPGEDEPWHFVQPFNDADLELVEIIRSHYRELVSGLRLNDMVRASFEAAWLAHALVDGLTPAHHYPYEEELEYLRGGESKDTRNSIKEKLLMHGETKLELAINNWKMWGAKGLFLTHSSFEIGVAMLILPMRMRKALPRLKDCRQVRKMEIGDWFLLQARDVAGLQLYDAFYRTGWTIPLGNRIKRELAPRLVRAVTLVWWAAAKEAKKGAKK